MENDYKESWLTVIIFIIGFLFIAFIYEYSFNKEHSHKSMPPGWHIEMSSIGYAWVDDNGYRSYEKDTEKEAIKYAWEIYEHIKERENLIWVPVEIGEENEP